LLVKVHRTTLPDEVLILDPGPRSAVMTQLGISFRVELSRDPNGVNLLKPSFFSLL
jgi:hypothetical protein